MLDRTIRELLRLFPKGATDEQLIWRLRSSGLRVNASDLLANLVTLSQRGDIVREPYGRWKAASFDRPHEARRLAERYGLQGSRPDEVLYAIPAMVRARTTHFDDAPQNGGGGSALPANSVLLGYYAATQRADPRGTVEEFADRHGRVWQLLQPSGRWWDEAELRVAMEHLPETLREALSRRAHRTAAIGWPIAVFRVAEGVAQFPALILAVTWRIEGPDLVLEPGGATPSLNPAWLREVRRNSVWRESALIDRLFPEGEETDIAAVGDRMRYALATLGGSALHPSEPAPELSLTRTGLTNGAGFFLPEDGTFTKGVADDLEALRSWDDGQLAPTALGAVLSLRNPSPAVSDVPVLSPNTLTDSQCEAAEAALSGSLTVIQGPPGTGKSQVILALVLSAVAAGRSVLVAAKNHQAVDEVERRLRELVRDAPLLIRARDAEGERNVSFLDALADLARGETVEARECADRDVERQGLLRSAQDAQAARHRSREALRLHLTLSELTERLDFLERFVLASVPVQRRSWLGRLLVWFRRRTPSATGASLATPLPEHAGVPEILARRVEILTRLKALDEDQCKIRGELDVDLGATLRAVMPRLARAMTLPDADMWRHLSERAREVEFNRLKSVRRMSEEDARVVTRYRPVWAVSTLSAPSRIPLVANLFDYVIFDEASQCDVASALPLMARARHAVVVGDPMQLRFVPPLGKAAEHALMDGLGLPPRGRAAIAQSTNSLFDFCEHRPGVARKFLADQFRSAPSIVDYLNADFYGGKLTSRRAEDSFSAPAGYKAGLAWDDIAGHATRRDGGTVNHREAEQVAQILKRIATDRTFAGSVGVISPFNAQVAELQSRIDQALPPAERERLSLRVATVDRFQGGEADVILFSLVLSASAPHSARTFLQKERRRLNVAISRARALCIIVGDLTYARSCGIHHIAFLAERATKPWSPPRPHQHDSSWERRLDVAMRGRGWNPLPQYPIGTRYLDFALDPEGAKLDVEVDGRRWHVDSSGNRKVSDRLRDAEMQARGWRVLRFWVHELANDMEGCLDRIERELERG